MNIADRLYVGIRGSVLALSRSDGTILWQTKLKGSEYVTLVSCENDILAATAGEVFCLDAGTGAPRWHNPLRGWGTGLAFLLVPEAASDPQTLLMAEARRREEARRAASAVASSST